VHLENCRSASYQDISKRKHEKRAGRDCRRRGAEAGQEFERCFIEAAAAYGSHASRLPGGLARCTRLRSTLPSPQPKQYKESVEVVVANCLVLADA